MPTCLWKKCRGFSRHRTVFCAVWHTPLQTNQSRWHADINLFELWPLNRISMFVRIFFCVLWRTLLRIFMALVWHLPKPNQTLYLLIFNHIILLVILFILLRLDYTGVNTPFRTIITTYQRHCDVRHLWDTRCHFSSTMYNQLTTNTN